MKLDYKENSIEAINQKDSQLSFEPFIKKGFKVFELNKSNEIYNKSDLLKEIFDVCNFPGYFGFNWDALRDCINDFSFNEASGYVFVFWNCSTLKQRLEKGFDILSDILIEACERWKEEKVVFKVFMNFH